MSKNLGELAGRKGIEEILFDKLGQATDNGVINKLSDDYLFGKANIYGAASFYDFLKPGNKDKKVFVCNGSACLTAGTQDSLKQKLLTVFKENEIGEMCCLGRCHENSAFNYNDKNYSASDIENLDKIVADHVVSNEKYNTGHWGQPVLMANDHTLEDIHSIISSALNRSPVDLLDELKLSLLRGRGGAGFPIYIKLDSCRKEVNEEKYIVCNADEGDPGAYTDRYLLEEKINLVLAGMMIAGYITGASYGVVYIRGEYPEAIRICEEAIARLKMQGLAGKNILNTSFNFHFKIVAAKGAYICGEETALLSSIEGQRPEVRVRPPYPVQQGLFNKPTVVNNVETLACIPFIIKNGGKNFAAIGKGRSSGTKLVSLDGHFNSPGVYEVEMGTALSVVTDQLGKGFKSKIKALHIGGPLGGLVPVSKIDSLSLDFESFASDGFLLGHASIVCIPETFPMIRYLQHLFQFTAHESCGKCFPCRIGSVRGAEMLSSAMDGSYKIDPQLFNDLIETLETGSLCALGGGLPLPVKNALRYFPEELSVYFKKN